MWRRGQGRLSQEITFETCKYLWAKRSRQKHQLVRHPRQERWGDKDWLGDQPGEGGLEARTEVGSIHGSPRPMTYKDMGFS